MLRALGGFGIRTLVSHPPTLEELFLRQYGEAVGDPAEPDAVAPDASA